MVYGLRLVHKKAWVDHMVTRVRKTLGRLFDEFTAFRGSNISAPTRTPTHPFEAGVGKMYKLEWSERLEQNPWSLILQMPNQKWIDLGNRSSPINTGFDILSWWKTNTVKYPTLEKIAHNILVIPVSTVVSESAFSTRECILDSFSR